MSFTLTQLHGFGAGGSANSMIGILSDLGLTASLVCALDAGDITSYPGSGQTWSDTSGNGNHYQCGTTSGSDANDPTFNGVAGALDQSNYWSFDTNDYFSPATTTTFDDDWHKDNGTFTLAAVAWFNGSTVHSLGGNDSANIGGFWRINNSEKISSQWTRTNGGSVNGFTGTTSVTLAAIQFVAVAYDEATTSFMGQVNATQDTDTFVASTATNNPTTDWFISNDTNGNRMGNNDRLYTMMAWNRKLSATELTTLYTALKARRFISLP